jgi:plasmid stabilization system protein ParE
MNLRFTRSALADLGEIRAYLSVHYPGTQPAVERRLQNVLSRIATFPQSGCQIIGRPGVRMAPLIRYPNKTVYRVTPGGVEILRIHHTARSV